MRILEFIHDEDHPEITNIDLWVKEQNYLSQKIYVYKNTEFPNLASFDLLILHGGGQHLWNKTNDPWLIEEVAYVKKALIENKQVIGFCLGSQLIAEALGARVYHSLEKELGWYKIQLYPTQTNHVLVQGLENGFISFLWHADHYELPKDCLSLGYTNSAENQIIVSKKAPAVGFQFHPEYSKENITYYFKAYLEKEWLAKEENTAKEFLKNTEKMPDTYLLFKKLMDNAVKWLSLKFNTLT